MFAHALSFVTREETERQTHQRAFVKRLTERNAAIDDLQGLAHRFVASVQQRTEAAREPWLVEAERSAVA